MTLITQYRVVQADSGVEQCICETPSFCPECGRPLKYRDSKIRTYKTYNGEKHLIKIRRLKCCTEGGCGRLHNELPSFLLPYKHYICEIVENVIEGVSTPDDLTTENYPCEMTMRRWSLWFYLNCILLEMTARFLKKQNRIPAIYAAAEGSACPVLGAFINGGAGWLAFLIRFIYNCGGRLRAWRG